MDKITIKKEKNNSTKVLDFKVAFRELRSHAKVYYVSMPLVLILAYLILVCIPRYYTSSVTLAPETTDSPSGGFSSTLSSLGISALSKLGNNDAISPDLYPDLIESNDFVIKMFPLEVTTKDNKITTSYYDYLAHHRKQAWWNLCIGYIIDKLKTPEPDNYKGRKNEEIKVFSMTKKQQEIAALIKHNTKCNIDQKTGSIGISVTDQDPRISAQIANQTAQQLLAFIIEYRTKKAKNDYAYYSKLCDKAKYNYERSRQVYAAYSDANFDPNLESIRSKLEDLENDMQLKFNVYSSMSTQKQAALAKIQEKMPAFTTIESATIPTRPAGPKRAIGAIAIMLLYSIVLSVYYLRKYIC